MYGMASTVKAAKRMVDKERPEVDLYLKSSGASRAAEPRANPTPPWQSGL